MRRSTFLAWFVAIATLAAVGCGGDDATSVADVRFDGAADAEDSHPDARLDGTPDAASIPDAPTVDLGNPPQGDVQLEGDADAQVGQDADQEDHGMRADSSPDVSLPDAPVLDVSPPDAGGPDVSPDVEDASTELPPSDAGPDTQAHTDADANANVDATADVDAGSPDVATDAGADVAADTGADVALDAGPEAAETHVDADGGPDAPDASVADAPADARSEAESSAPEMVHWNIEASPPECFATPSAVDCFDLGIFQVLGETGCPAANTSEANLWFPGGVLPATGQHVVRPAAGINDAHAVTGNQVAVQLNRMAPAVEFWWGQSGTVDVEIVGGRRSFRFSGVTAFEESDHSRTTTLGGFLVCGP